MWPREEISMDNQKPLTRQDYNRMLADILIASIERYPDWRFGQHLRNLELIKESRDINGMPTGWIDEFNLEPKDLLVRAGGYKAILEKLGAFVKDNAKMAAKRLGVDERSIKIREAREAKERK